MIGARTIAGHSMPLNVLFVLVNLVGLTLTTIGFHDNFEDQRILLVSIGMAILALSTVGLILFKGKLMIATVSRVLVGALFIVSGLIKANDPVGFSYKLEDYFEDGALAFRIKEWFGAPGFSLEFLIDYAVALSVIICVAEIVLGVLVIIGGKIRLVGWSLLIMMLFFTFLTWHTANCDGNTKFTDRDTYEMSNPLAAAKLEESKTNKEIKIVSKSSNELVVDELRSPQCVNDCGCFGDAMKGSVGRSLTPKESLWKDIVLLYLVIWIFAAQRIVEPNTVKQNWAILPIVFVLITFFCWVFNWYFPLLFGIISIITSLWIYRSGGKLLGNHYGAALMTTFWSSFFVWYVISYDPLKDYRPYAVGSNLLEKTKDGDDGKRIDMLVYKNKKNGSIRKYDATSKEYINSKIWEQSEVWEYDTMLPEIIRPMRLPSITAQFNPFLPLNGLTKYEKEFAPVMEQLKGAVVPGLRIVDIVSQERMEIPAVEYNIESYPVESYQIIDTIEVANPEFSEISVREYLFNANEVMVVFAKNLKEMDKSSIKELKTLYAESKAAGIPFIFVVNAEPISIAQFRSKYNFKVPTFINDETEIKAISRSNPCLLVLKKGVVVGKYPHRSLPKFEWVQKNLLKK